MEQHIKKTVKLVSIILLSVLLHSCMGTKSLLVQIPQRPEDELPSDIQSLTIVNRTVDGRYQDYPVDSLQKIFYEHDFNLDTVIYDIQSVDTTLKVLGQLLFESGRYDYVIPVNRFLDFEKNPFLTPVMPWSQVKELCDNYNTDAVLSMDHYKTKIKTKFSRLNFLANFNLESVSAYYASLEIEYEMMFRVYFPAEEKMVYSKLLRDTLYWDNNGTTVRELFNNLTTVKKALTESGIDAALQLTDKISTNWKDEYRIYFSKGDDEFKQASHFVDEGDWERAITIWKNIVEKSSVSKSLKSKAQFNVAVGYEILGDIDLAISWALDSYNTQYRTSTYKYLEILRERKNALKNQGK